MFLRRILLAWLARRGWKVANALWRRRQAKRAQKRSAPRL